MRPEILAGLLAAACAACSDSRGSPAASATVAAHADPRAEALAADIRAILDAIERGDESAARARASALALPRAHAWFGVTFGPAGERLAAEYDPLARQLPQLVDALRPWVGRGSTSITAERFTEPTDPAATGYQAAALEAMARRVPLYSVRIAAASDGGPPAVFHLWSFVDVDGQLRWIGKLRPVVGAPPGTGVDPLELRVRDRAATPP